MDQLGEILSFGLRERMDGVDRAVRRPNLEGTAGIEFEGFRLLRRGLGPAAHRNERRGRRRGRRPIEPTADCGSRGEWAGPIGGRRDESGGGAGRGAADEGGDGFGSRGEPAGDAGASIADEIAGRSGGVQRSGVMKKLGGGGGGEGDGWVCCVCMGRKKGAAFIPCGHTFCRVCSRELWLHRGSCPLCNRPILEILQIY